jgi:hypothetical protein
MRHSTLPLLAICPLVASVQLVACGTTTAPSPSGDAGVPLDGGRDVFMSADASLDAPSRHDVAAPPVDAAPALCADYNADKNLYWGDLHTHTALSADAYGWGNRNFPHDAYRFASDPSVETPIAAGAATPGPRVSIDRALDWDAVTDHSEWLGATWGCGENPDGGPFNPASPYFASAACAHYRAQSALAELVSSAEEVLAVECDGGLEHDPACSAFTASAWQIEVQAAHDAYHPCKFTSLVAYEWTRDVAGATLHQNVIFSGENVPALPFDALEYTQPGDLWSALDQSCKEDAGCQVLTIPHNGNLGEGMAYAIPSGLDAMQQMNRYQRLTEIHQHKGNSECYAGSKSTDPTCAFEHVPASNGGSEYTQNFVRSATARGIVQYAAQMEAGADATDPLQMGIVGATDDHNGIPGYVREDTWQGHVGDVDDTAVARLTKAPFHNPGGITGVWAEQNTREAIFAALFRRETFATSGPRMTVRFYQVWGSADYCAADGGGGGFPANVLAAGGVPMGSAIPPPSHGSLTPSFVINALKDEADLAEVDVVKGMVVGGELTETVTRFTPASSDTAWSSGSACIRWTDEAFAPGSPAFYYVRVLEVPTPRWSHYDCKAAPATPGCEPDGGLDVMIQERAWTSPIWWLP